MNNEYDELVTFGQSLKVAQKYEPMWLEYYSKKFPNYQKLIKTKEEKSLLQDAGVDRIIITEEGQQITFDEKTLQNVYNEFAFEYISNSLTNSPGWINKPLICDYINYAFGPTQEIYAFNRVVIQSVWKKYGSLWLTSAKKNISGGPYIIKKETPVGYGMSYLTYNCAIPKYIIEQLYKDELLKPCINPLRYCLLDDEKYIETLKEYNIEKNKSPEEKRKEVAKRIKQLKNK
jgi:hypothetical protein